jgi:hypothetical protein
MWLNGSNCIISGIFRRKRYKSGIFRRKRYRGYSKNIPGVLIFGGRFTFWAFRSEAYYPNCYGILYQIVVESSATIRGDPQENVQITGQKNAQ